MWCQFCTWTFVVTAESEFVLAVLAHDFHLRTHVAEMIAETRERVSEGHPWPYRRTPRTCGRWPCTRP